MNKDGSCRVPYFWRIFFHGARNRGLSDLLERLIRKPHPRKKLDIMFMAGIAGVITAGEADHCNGRCSIPGLGWGRFWRGGSGEAGRWILREREVERGYRSARDCGECITGERGTGKGTGLPGGAGVAASSGERR